MNTCSGCGACCEVVPVRELKLTGFTRCPHLRGMEHAQGIGCGIYEKRPHSCRAWKCEWLKSDWEAKYRPDRCGLIVDEIHDMISLNDVQYPAAQIWVMPGHEDDWQNTDEAASLIMTCINDGAAVLWRMKNHLTIAFWKDPKTGKIWNSGPRPPRSDEADEMMGVAGKRMWEAEEMLRKKRGRQ